MTRPQEISTYCHGAQGARFLGFRLTPPSPVRSSRLQLLGQVQQIEEGADVMEPASSSTAAVVARPPARKAAEALRQNIRRASAWGERPVFQIAPIYAGGVHIGWGATCGRHHNDTGKALPCRKTINSGSGQSRLTDSECILRLKRWLVAGLSDAGWGNQKRTHHVSQGGWQLEQFKTGMTDQELNAQVGHAAAIGA